MTRPYTKHGITLMLYTTNPVIKYKASLLNQPEKLSNVSKFCKIMSVSQDTFYRNCELVDKGGVDEMISIVSISTINIIISLLPEDLCRRHLLKV